MLLLLHMECSLKVEATSMATAAYTATQPLTALARYSAELNATHKESRDGRTVHTSTEHINCSRSTRAGSSASSDVVPPTLALA